MNIKFMYEGKEFFIERITTFKELEQWWPVIVEGLPGLNEYAPEKRRISSEYLLQVSLMCIEMGTEASLFGVITSKNGKPLGWVMVLENTLRFKDKTCVVFAAYSNGKCPGLTKGVLVQIEKWAKENEFKEIQAMSFSFNGSRFRLFERTWKMRRTAVLFTKEL